MVRLRRRWCPCEIRSSYLISFFEFLEMVAVSCTTYVWHVQNSRAVQCMRRNGILCAVLRRPLVRCGLCLRAHARLTTRDFTWQYLSIPEVVSVVWVETVENGFYYVRQCIFENQFWFFMWLKQGFHVEYFWKIQKIPWKISKFTPKRYFWGL